jgi:Na+/H+-dicarboxylate symporter
MSIKRRFSQAYKTIGALAGLIAGFTAGLAAHASQSETLLALVPSLAPVGALWINALRMTIIPLVVAGLIVVITAIPSARALGRLSGLSLTIFLALLAFGVALALFIAPPVIRRLPIDRLNLPAPGAVEAQDSEGGNKATGQRNSVAWIDGLVPPNLIKAADGQLLPLMVFAVLFGLALTRLDPELQSTVVELCRGVTAALHVLIRWIFWLAPIGIFALAFVTAARTGSVIAGAVGWYVALQCALLFAYTLLLYPATAVLGQVGIGRFARALAPAQMIAVSTRSSLAALPAMIAGAATILRLSAVGAGFMLPLSVSVLKINRSITPAVRLLFLSQLYGIPLTPVQVAGFLLTTIAFGFTTPGLPTGTTMATLPLYLALGIPIEGVLIFRAADAITDIFSTLLNVTGDLTAATLLAKFTGTTAAEEGNQISPVAPYPG